jgi:YVTN family beta-propeller protein
MHNCTGVHLNPQLKRPAATAPREIPQGIHPLQMGEGCSEEEPMKSSSFILLVCVAIFLAFQVVPMEAYGTGVIKLPKTGQRSCYDSTGKVIVCAGTGQDGEKRAGVAWPSPRFTDHLDGTITDRLTGLMWLKDANCMNTQYLDFDTDGAKDGKVTWIHALQFVAGINSGAYGKCGAGRTGWRLPNRVELASLIDRSKWNPALPEGHTFTGLRHGSSDFYWSSSTAFTDDAKWAWFMCPWDGLIEPTKKDLVLYVWPVRGTSTGPARLPRTGQTASYAAGDDGALKKGVPWPNPRFTDHHNGTIADNLTGLIWLKNGSCFGSGGSGYSNWTKALEAVNSLRTDQCGLADGSGVGDWRLPNVNEIQSLAHTEKWEIGSWLNTQGFTGMERGWYWTSTTFPGEPNKAWDMNMIDGHIQDGPITKSYTMDYVWAVRGGTGPGLPVVTTSPVTDITKTGATGGGEVTSDGGAIVTARGVCWSVSHDPTIADKHTTDGTGTGEFTSLITGLAENTTYYVRAYGTNEEGTAYGEETQFRTGQDEPFAYISHMFNKAVTVIDTATNTVVGSPITVGNGPTGVAVNPTGRRVYVANFNDDTVSVIDGTTNTVIGSPIPVGDGPRGIVVNPAGTRVYVANWLGNSVSVINAATNTVMGVPVPVGDNPWGIVANPSGTRVYVANWLGDSVSVIDTATNTVVGSPIPVGDGPRGIAMNPTGTRVYVANNNSDSVSVIDTATNTVVGSPIPVGDGPYGIAVNPAGTRVYVTANNSNTLSVIDTTTNKVVGSPISVGNSPIGVTTNPKGSRVYVVNYGSDTISVLDGATHQPVGSPISVIDSPTAFGQFIKPALPSFTLTVKKTGDGVGSVTPDKGVLTWVGKTGKESYDSGAKVVLTAEAASGSLFAGWGGACASAGTNLKCTVKMTGSKTATATFNPKP